MINIIAEHKFYKSKSVMILSHQIGVNYNKSENYIELKFATRPDNKSPANWKDENRFFITGYVALFNFVKDIDDLLKKKVDKVSVKNPMKKTGIQLRYNVGEDGTKWIVFYFFLNDDKIAVSLNYKTEFLGLYQYLKNLLSNYHTLSAIALFRNDYNYLHYGKNKNDNKRSNNSSNMNENVVVDNDDITDDIDADVDSILDDDVPF